MGPFSADRAQPEGRSLPLARIEGRSEGQNPVSRGSEEGSDSFPWSIAVPGFWNVAPRIGEMAETGLKRVACRGRRSAYSPFGWHPSPPGLLPTIGYVDLRSMNPSQFADFLYSKVRSGVPVSETISGHISSDLEKELAGAVVLAEEYLLPQPLSMAEAVAVVVRRSFEDASIVPRLSHVAPYLRNAKAAYRVVGYLACQVAARRSENLASWALELTACLGRERKEALEHNETRSLWQLLVCLGHVLRAQLTYSDRDYVRKTLVDMQSFLRDNPHIDPGGECKWKIGDIMGATA